ncbi:hypothetical protein ACWC2T_45280, partial [Streptomyces sp. NPDC001393]
LGRRIRQRKVESADRLPVPAARADRHDLAAGTGKGSGRVLMAGMICVRPGRETRMIYRTQTYRGRRGEKKGFRARCSPNRSSLHAVSPTAPR